MVMTLVKWRNEYGVGAESIDDEHKALIDRINRLDDQLIAEDGPLSASTFFEQLTETITAHFGREERFMRERGYDQLPEFKEDYERFLDEIYSLIDEFDRNEKASREDLTARLDGWFSDHFETHDVRLAEEFDWRSF
jgi:hemerythrin-like metal-binding protein